jgi:nitroreductase
MNEQPWAFVVIQGAARLESYSDRIKRHLLGMPGAIGAEATRLLGRDDVSIFHKAPVLMVICATADDEQAIGDCSLAAQNVMLAAFACGFGTCPIGFSRPWLRLVETKREIGIPEDLIPTFPIALGFPDERPERPERRAPRVIYLPD